jgi:hypothetical protein
VFNDAELYDLRCWRTQIASESSRVCVLVENALLERNARQLGFEVASQFDCQRLFQHDAELAQELAARFW